MSKKITTEEAIKRSIETHGDRYDYSLVECNKGSSSKVKIICLIHGIFEQIIKNHYNGSNCPNCIKSQYGKDRTYNVKKFIKKAKIKHNNKYDYSKVIYIKSNINVKIICPIHGVFEQQPYAHLNGNGCNGCGIELTIEKRTIKKEEWIKRFINIHGNKYSYGNSKFNNDKIEIICDFHGSFFQRPIKHFQGQGCPTCCNNSKLLLEDVLTRFNNKHGKKYTYNITNILDIKTNNIIEILCPIHGMFKQSIRNHFKNDGCIKCSISTFSKIAINWLNSFNLNIQHAGNIGEYKLSETIVNGDNRTGIKVDGYHKETNTVYEFLGDCWHGNPNIYEPNDKPHPHNNKIALELNQEWLNRKQILEDLAYNVIYIWENDYKKTL